MLLPLYRSGIRQTPASLRLPGTAQHDVTLAMKGHKMINASKKRAAGGAAVTHKSHRTDGSQFLTPHQVAERWGWHVESVRRAVRERRIESVVIFRRRLIPLAEVERIEAEGRIARAA